MNKVITLSIISISLLLSGTPIHDLMDHRIKGKSFSGTIDDNNAAQDGLGILPLQHHTGTVEINNELLVQKVFDRVLQIETDISKTINIKQSITSGISGTVQDTTILNNLGFSLSYIPGSLTNCSDIKSNYPLSSSGSYLLSNGKTEQCDMTGSGIAIYTSGTAPSCKTIIDNYPSSPSGKYTLSDGKTYYCEMETDGGGWTLLMSSREQIVAKNSGTGSYTVNTLPNYNNWNYSTYNSSYEIDPILNTSKNIMTDAINLAFTDMMFKCNGDATCDAKDDNYSIYRHGSNSKLSEKTGTMAKVSVNGWPFSVARMFKTGGNYAESNMVPIDNINVGANCAPSTYRGYYACNRLGTSGLDYYSFQNTIGLGVHSAEWYSERLYMDAPFGYQTHRNFRVLRGDIFIR